MVKRFESNNDLSLYLEQLPTALMIVDEIDVNIKYIKVEHPVIFLAPIINEG